MKEQMIRERNTVVLTSNDYNMLVDLVRGIDGAANEMTLKAEIYRAVVVSNDALPPNTIRLNSIVSILNLENNKIMNFKIVMPEYADIKKNKVSILTPMGTAIIGFRKGEVIEWKMPAGLKTFRILDVR